MKISINNFKSIGSLTDYGMYPMTILSGTNSSGKSSFIQLLLLLKQTLEIDSSQRPLDLNGKLFSISDYLDILKNKDKNNKLKIKFIFNKSEINEYHNFPELSIYGAFDNYDLCIEIEFDIEAEKIIVSSFTTQITTHLKTDFIKFYCKANEYDIKTNVAVFNDELYFKEYKVKKINYSSFFPSDYEIVLGNGTILKDVPKLDGIKAILKNIFSSISYIGPLRQAPKDEYPPYERSNSVGIEGENTAEMLHEQSERLISFLKLEEENNTIKFINNSDTFLKAVKYWICDRFNLCRDIYSKKEADNYVIYVKSLSGVESTIKHVGFGISQILPIIVEGLRINKNEILVLEQPEVHLHPKVQSQLTDFLLSLIQMGKKVIIETHSDHMITRLRRRIAEDSENQLDNKVLLTFVEVGFNDVLFKNIEINNFGMVEIPYPEDFIERADIELKAILKAQMKKRLTQS